MKALIVAKIKNEKDIEVIISHVKMYLSNFTDDLKDVSIITNSMIDVDGVLKIKEFVFSDAILETCASISSEDNVIFYYNIPNSTIKNYDCNILIEGDRVIFSNKSEEDIKNEKILNEAINIVLTHIVFSIEDSIEKDETVSFLKRLINE